MNPPGRVSIVVPLQNESEALRELATEILANAGRLPSPFEVLFVDDGSTDDSWNVVRSLAESDARIVGIRFRRNFGKAAALAAGFAAAKGDVVFTLDGDLQDDPVEMPRFLEALNAGADVVCGWKQVRHDPWHKTFPSRVFNGLVRWMTGVNLHDHNCGYKCFRAEVLREIRVYGELHRFLPALAAARGFRIAEVVVHHRPRRFGRSKYGWNRFLRGLLDLFAVRFITAYRGRPQHLLGTWSLAIIAMALASPLLGRFAFGAQLLQVVWLGSAGLVLMGVGLAAALFVDLNHRLGEGYAIAEEIRPRG